MKAISRAIRTVALAVVACALVAAAAAILPAGNVSKAGGGADPFTLVLEQPLSAVTWGDTVRCTGGGANGTVRVLIDDAVVGEASPDAGGVYVFDYLVDRLAAGPHLVRAEAGPDRAAEAGFEVVPLTPVVLLEVAPTEWQNAPALLCQGNVTAGGRPVPGANVHLAFNSYGTADVVTGRAGQYELVAGVAGGSHTVVANVSFEDGRALAPAESAPARAELPGGGESFPVLPTAAVLGVVLLGGAVGFVLWRRGAGGGAGAPPPSGAPPGGEAPPAIDTTPELRATAHKLVGDGGRAGMESLYRGLAARLAVREPNACLETLTPRELQKRFARTPAGPGVALVVDRYEAVAYAGREPDAGELAEAVEGFVAALAGSAPAAAAPADGPGIAPVDGGERARARRLVGIGGRDGIAAVYHDLQARLVEREPGERLDVMTPRELARRFEGTPRGPAVGLVADCYEAAVYGGRAPSPAEVEAVVEAYATALAGLSPAPADAPDAPAAATPPEEVEPPEVAALRATARKLAGDGGREGVQALYRGLATRLAEREPGARIENMTPRELARHFEGTPAGPGVSTVADCYEAVVYGGRVLSPVDLETAVEGFVAPLAETARAGE